MTGVQTCALPIYHALSFIDVSKVRPGLKIVADTANGMGGLVAPAVLKRLPVTFEILFPELDGTFPNHPADPIQLENLRDLQAAVLASHADIGLAFDGDADRVFLVDERGQPISGSTTTSMVAAAVLDKNPGATVLYNCICSKAVREVILEHGGVAIRTRVGHSFIKALMAENDAVFGGEHSAHYYFMTTGGPTPGSLLRFMCWNCSRRPTGERRSVRSVLRSSATPVRVRSTPRWPTLSS